MDVPPPITPDGKDWTWVIGHRCARCGHAGDPRSVAEALRANAATWVSLLRPNRSELAARPDPTTWSRLEYACHVRDVVDVYHERLGLVLTHDGPHYPDWDQDATALVERHDRADPTELAPALPAGADRLAGLFETVADDQWTRTGLRSDGAAFTIDTFPRYLLNDPAHHICDVGEGSTP